MGRNRKSIEQEAPKIKDKEEIMEDFTPLPPEVIERHNRVDRQYFDTLPPGYRFAPTGAELILYYLWNKLLNLNMPLNRIRDANVYSVHPRDLTGQYQLHREKEWYFFTPRNRKYPNGKRPDRAAGYGFWKATGADVGVLDEQGREVGTKRALVYYEGKPKDKNQEKTNWIMHEYKHKDDNTNNIVSSDKKKLDDWVLCMIYYKTPKKEVPNQNTNGVGVDNAASSSVISSIPATSPEGSSIPVSSQASSSIPENSIASSPMRACYSMQASNPIHASYSMQPSSSRQYQQVRNCNPRHGSTQVENHMMNVPTDVGQVPNQYQNGICFENALSVQYQNGIGFENALSVPVQNGQIPNPNTEPGLDGSTFDNMDRFHMPAGYPMLASNYPMHAYFPMQNRQVENLDTSEGTNFNYFSDVFLMNESMPTPNPIQALSFRDQYPIIFQPSTENYNNMGMHDIQVDPPNSLSYGTHSQVALHEPTQVHGFTVPFGSELEDPLEPKDGQLPSLDNTTQRPDQGLSSDPWKRKGV